MGLKVFAEGELFGESEAVGHFLDGHAGLYEEVLGLVDSEELNPLLGRLAGVLLDERGEVAYRQAGLGGIVGHVEPVGVVERERFHEVHKELLAVRRGVGRGFLGGCKLVQYFQNYLQLLQRNEVAVYLAEDFGLGLQHLPPGDVPQRTD